MKLTPEQKQELRESITYAINSLDELSVVNFLINEIEQLEIELPGDEEIDNAAIVFCNKHYEFELSSGSMDDITKETEVFDAGVQFMRERIKSKI